MQLLQSRALPLGYPAVRVRADNREGVSGRKGKLPCGLVHPAGFHLSRSALWEEALTRDAVDGVVNFPRDGRGVGGLQGELGLHLHHGFQVGDFKKHTAAIG